MRTPLLFLLAASIAAQAQNTSAYSTLDEKVCKTLKVSSEDSSSEQTCPGVGGYKLRVLDEDSRQSITVVSPDGKQHPLNFSPVVTDHFSSVGPRAEWRLKSDGATLLPIALTVRLNVNEDGGITPKLTSYLVVSRVDAQLVCVVRFIKSSAAALDDARRIADQASTMACLKSAPPTH